MYSAIAPLAPKANDQFQVQFWGVRGSIACPGKDTVRYGGNTPCVEMRVGTERLIFDAGTGIRLLGEQMMSESLSGGNTGTTGHIFFSHSHWDHIQGFPFFSPAFIPKNRFDIYGGFTPNGISIQERLNTQMMDPNFPVPLKIMGAEMHFHNLAIGEVVQLGNVMVTSAPLNHPGGATGYRVNYGGRSAAYITDTEHHIGELDANILKFVEGVDLFIYDCTYTDDEYNSPTSSKVGWGHSTWQEGIRLAQAAGVKDLVIFHHDPSHDDLFMDEIARSAKTLFPGAIVAQEGKICDLLAS